MTKNYKCSEHKKEIIHIKCKWKDNQKNRINAMTKRSLKEQKKTTKLLKCMCYKKYYCRLK